MRLGTNRNCWWPDEGGRNSLQRRAARRNTRAWSRARTASAVFVASGLGGSSSMTRSLADVSMLARPRRGRAAGVGPPGAVREAGEQLLVGGENRGPFAGGVLLD